MSVSKNFSTRLVIFITIPRTSAGTRTLPRYLQVWHHLGKYVTFDVVIVVVVDVADVVVVVVAVVVIFTLQHRPV